MNNKIQRLFVPASLITLSVQNNNLDEESFYDIGQLKHLKYLNVHNTGLKSLEPLYDLTQLEELFVTKNPIRKIQYELDRMENLTKFNISGDKLYKVFTRSHNIARLVLDSLMWEKLIVNIDTIRAYGKSIRFNIRRHNKQLGTVLIANDLEDNYNEYTSIVGKWLDEHQIIDR